jgi:hypothetical protein
VSEAALTEVAVGVEVFDQDGPVGSQLGQFDGAEQRRGCLANAAFLVRYSDHCLWLADSACTVSHGAIALQRAGLHQSPDLTASNPPAHAWSAQA